WWYDATDNPVRTETGNTTDPAQWKPQRVAATYAYDAVNRKVSATEAAEVQGDGLTPLRLTTGTTYDAADDPAFLVDARGAVTWQSFDALGRMTGRVEAFLTEVARTTTLAYDPADNLLSEEHQRYHAGQVPTETLPPTVTTSYGYDNLDRKVAVVGAYGSGSARTTTTTYDANDNVVKVTDPLGRVTSYAYDRLDRRTTVVEAYGDADFQRTSTVTYDAADNLRSEVRPRAYDWEQFEYQ